MSTTLEVFDKPLCCSSGVCGPAVDPILVRFAADLDWLRGQGVRVERYNLAQQPAPFAANADVKAALEQHGTGCLPLFRVDGAVVYQGKYPSRSMLARWCGLASVTPLPAAGAPACGPPGCC